MSKFEAYMGRRWASLRHIRGTDEQVWGIYGAQMSKLEVLYTWEGLVANLRILSPIGRSDDATILFDLSSMVNNEEDVNEGFEYRRADYGNFPADLSLNVDRNEKFIE